MDDRSLIKSMLLIVTTFSYVGGAVYLLCMITTTAFGGAGGANYTISTTNAGDATLDRAVAPGGSHEGLTKTQVLQRNTNAFLRSLSEQQASADVRELEKKMLVASPASKVAAENALNAGISVPVVADITNKTNNVDQSPIIPIVATDPDGLPLHVTATGLPPGMAVRSNAQTGDPEIRGTLTTAGTFTVTVHAMKFSDIEGTDTFSWVINP